MSGFVGSFRITSLVGEPYWQATQAVGIVCVAKRPKINYDHPFIDRFVTTGHDNKVFHKIAIVRRTIYIYCIYFQTAEIYVMV